MVQRGVLVRTISSSRRSDLDTKRAEKVHLIQLGVSFLGVPLFGWSLKRHQKEHNHFGGP